MIIWTQESEEQLKNEIKNKVSKEFIVKLSNLIQKTYADKG